MPSLEDLESEFPVIDSNFRRFCASHGVFTVEDFLVCDLYKLVAFAEQLSTAEELKQGVTQILCVIDGMHQPWQNGIELFEDVQQNKHMLSTGCEGIDLLLQGGLRQGQLIELVGPSSSGKTQVCLQAASNVAGKDNGRVIFIDTCNSFSPTRIAGFVDCFLGHVVKKAKERNLEAVMSNILCHSVFDIFTLLDVLHQLDFKLRSQVMKGDGDVSLIIIDSISSLVTPILGNGAHGRSLMVSTGFVLKKLAHENNISLLVTNHMVGGGDSIKPALGESWKSIPHIRLLLSRDHGSNICNVSVLKHPSMASGRTERFMIHD